MKLGPTLAAALYALLVGSFSLMVWARRYPETLPPSLERASPWVFLAFVAAFSFYRMGLVRAGKYPVSKAFFQIGAGVLLFALMLPSARAPFARQEDPLAVSLRDPNPRVRALAAELARHREGGARYAPALVRVLGDDDPEVRAQAHESLVVLNGKDLGDPREPRGIDAWRERYP